MSLFGSIMNDFDDDPLFGAHMRQMQHMNSMMSSMFADPFGMMGDMGGPLSIMGAHHHPRGPMMPFMPQMNMNRLLTGGLDGNLMNGGNSYSSSTVYMSNGPDGRPQVYSSTSSTQVGPGGVKETRSTVQDSRTGTKKMSIGHHINDRAHVIEREQNVRSGDLEERQEFINIEEEEADEFNREFQQHLNSSGTSRGRVMGARPAPMLALPAPPAPTRRSGSRPGVTPRRALRQASASPLALQAAPSSASAGVRHTYGSIHPQRAKQRGSKHHHNTPDY